MRGKGGEVARVGQVRVEAPLVEAGDRGHLLDPLRVIDVEPVAMPGLQQRLVKVRKTALPACRLRRREGKPASDGFARGRTPNRPAVILGVHLREREIPPSDLDLAS